MLFTGVVPEGIIRQILQMPYFFQIGFRNLFGQLALKSIAADLGFSAIRLPGVFGVPGDGINAKGKVLRFQYRDYHLLECLRFL